MPPKHNLAARLKTARLKADLTQTELAAAAGCAQGNVSDYERGSVEPSVSVLCRLCRALGVSADTLLGLAGKVPLSQMKRGSR